MTNARRRSNSSTAARGVQAFKSKFEVVESEPVFEDMPQEEDDKHIRLEQQSAASNSEAQSVEEEQN
jgi:hypothetical protein